MFQPGLHRKGSVFLVSTGHCPRACQAAGEQSTRKIVERILSLGRQPLSPPRPRTKVAAMEPLGWMPHFLGISITHVETLPSLVRLPEYVKTSSLAGRLSVCALYPTGLCLWRRARSAIGFLSVYCLATTLSLTVHCSFTALK